MEERKIRSTKRVLSYLRREAPQPRQAQPPPPQLPPPLEEDGLDLALLPLTQPSKSTKMFRRD